MYKGVSFRKPGFANSLVLRIGLLILFSLAAFTVSLYFLIGRPTIDRLAETQMHLAAEQLEARYTRLLKTVEVTLRSSHDWGLNGDLDHVELARFNEFFFPIIANHGEISSVIFAHESGREIFLLQTADGHWINRISNPNEWGRQTYWITWNAAREIERVEMREQDYDARGRPWFKGAMALPDTHSVYWTEPYIFYTTKDPGITAAMRWTAKNGSTYIIGHDVRLNSIAEYTTNLNLGSHGALALFQNDGKLIAPPNDPRFDNPTKINQAVLKTAEELDLPELAEGFRLWQAEPNPTRHLHAFSRPDGRWLSLFQPISNNSYKVWLGAVAPESDFIPISRQDMLLLGLITLAAIALGMAVALRIARRFGEPLNALAEASQRIGKLALDQPVSTDAPWREVTQLAAVLEGVRQHLNNSHQALEKANSELEEKVTRRTQALHESQDILQKREAFFRAIFDNAAVGILSLAPNHTPTLVNKAFARFIGHPVEHLRQHLDLSLLPAAELARMNQALEDIAHGQRQDLRSEFEFLDKDGQSRWGDVQIAPVKNENDEVDSLLLTVLDVSDRREIETELIRQFTFLQALLDTIPNPIFYKGAHTRFLGCNQAYEEFFGIERRSFIGKRVIDLDYLPEDMRQAYQAEDERVIAESSRVIREIEMLAADGSQHDMLYSVSGFRSPDGTPGGLIGVVVDISAQKAAERDADRARAAAEFATAAKADFLANMSHEIRTPMNAIIGMTYLALQTELTPRQKNYLDKVDNAAKGLLGIINDILDLSKIEAGMMHFERTPFSLDASLHHLGDLCTLKARESGLELLFDIAPEVPDRLVGDPLRLGQVLLNLVGNAIKFTEAGEIIVTIKLTSGDESSANLSFEVRDTGIGMSLEQQAHLFTAFSQGDTSTTRKYGGTGLGLSITKRIIDQLGGDISISSQPGKGSKFAFNLTFALPSGEVEPPRRLGLPDSLRTLVVDDSAGAREVFGHMLDAFGMDCQLAADGPQALAELVSAEQAGQPFGLIIIDWKMPGMDGVELLTHLRHRGSTLGEPAIIMCTAYDQEEMLAALGQHKIGAILGKPATPSSLFDSIVVALHCEASPVGESFGNSYAKPLSATRQFSGERILLVEDNDVNRELAEEMLNAVGLTVDLAENGQQAIERIKLTTYDLVLMDCQMPVMDGYEATQLIRQELQMPDLPIIAMTANALASDRQHCLSAGMNDHIPKPIDVAILYTTLERWLGNARPPEPSMPTAISPSSLVPEINIAAALARLGGNRTTYERLLSRFQENQRDVIERLQTAQQKGDTATMMLDAHTLRGLAGNIGAEALADCAGVIETRLKHGSTPDDSDINSLIAQLSTALQTILNMHLEGGNRDRINPASQGPDPETRQKALSHLAFLLDNDDATAARYYDEIAAWLTAQLDPTEAEQLARQIRQYEFEEALATLQQLDSKLSP